MATIIDGSTGIQTQAIDLVNPLPITEGGTALGSAGAAGNVLVSDGANWSSGSRFTQGTAVTLTNQATVDFTVPTWAKRITVMFTNLSSNGSSDYLIQLGSSSGIATTGYISHSTSVNTTSVSVSSTAGLIFINRDSSTDSLGGMMTLCNMTGNTWVSNVMCYIQGTNTDVGGGQVTLPNPITTVRLAFASGGTSTLFDVGTINVMYE